MRKGLFIVCLMLAAWGLASMATPVLTVDEPEYDYGSVGLGYMVKHTFVLQNTGDEVLNIVYVRASCGCTTTDLPTSSLAPGESVPLEVLVLADHGTSKNVSIYVHTNAPDTSGNANDDRMDFDIKLVVKGIITPGQEYTIAPYEVIDNMMILVDLREPAAYAANHLIGAINIPASQLEGRLDSLQKNAWIVVYDLAGEAADAAIQTLLSAGYMSSFYLVGGLSHWVAVHEDRYLVHETPLPEAGGSSTGGSSGRPYDQGKFMSDFRVVIDLRDADAYADGHLANAMNISIGQLSQWFDRFPKEKHVVVYDDDGTSAMAAYHVLQNAGFKYASVLLGGLNEWIYQYGDAYVLSE